LDQTILYRPWRSKVVAQDRSKCNTYEFNGSRMIWRSQLFPILSLTVALFQGCTHFQPLSSAEVESLTTCRATDLATMRKSLLLNGYEIKSQTDADLVTEFKQYSGFGGNQYLRRITIVKTGDKTYAFRIRLKHVSLENQHSPVLPSDTGNKRDKNKTIVEVNLAAPVKVEDEDDESYVESGRGDYEEVQREVCGSHHPTPPK